MCVLTTLAKSLAWAAEGLAGWRCHRTFSQKINLLTLPESCLFGKRMHAWLQVSVCC